MRPKRSWTQRARSGGRSDESSDRGFETQQDWSGAHYHLARLYQSQGQQEKAQILVNKLLQLWSEADPELPLLRDTRKLRAELGK